MRRFTRSTGSPARSCGRARISSARSRTSGRWRSPTAACTSRPTTTRCIASAFPWSTECPWSFVLRARSVLGSSSVQGPRSFVRQVYEMASVLNRSRVRDALDASAGILRLEPSWVPRTFMVPGRRLKLNPDDLYALGGHRGGINERWFSSTTNADNGPGTPPDEGLSYVALADGSRFLLKAAVDAAGDLLLGSSVMERDGGWNLLCKFFDNMGPIPHHMHQSDED